MLTCPSPLESLRTNQSGNPWGSRSCGERKRYDFLADGSVPADDVAPLPSEEAPEGGDRTGLEGEDEEDEDDEDEPLPLYRPSLAPNSSSVIVPSPLASASCHVPRICDHSSFSSTPFLFLSYWRRRLSAYLRILLSSWGGADGAAGEGGEEALEDGGVVGLLLEAELEAGVELETLATVTEAPNPGTMAVWVAAAPNPGTKVGCAAAESAVPLCEVPELGVLVPPSREPLPPRCDKASAKACTETGPEGSRPALRTTPS